MPGHCETPRRSVDSSTVCCCSLENTAAVSETAREGRTRPASTVEWDIGGDYRDTGVRCGE